MRTNCIVHLISIKTQVKEDLDEDMVNKPIETKEVVVNINRVLESDFTNGVSKDSNSPKKEEKEEEEEEKKKKKEKFPLCVKA